MHGFKKITSLFVSVVTALSLMIVSVSSTSAFDGSSGTSSNDSVFSTSSVWDKDPNGDGVLDIYDLISMRRYLSGLSGPTNLDDYDINGSGIISPFDLWVLEAYLTGILPDSVGENYTESVSSSAFSSKSYWKHDCNSSDASSHTVYTIDRPIATSGNTSVSSNVSVSSNISDDNFSSINSIPSKDSVEKDDNQAVVFLGMNGTGFIISDHIIVTAAHCVTKNEAKTNFIFSFDDIEITIKDKKSNDIATIYPKTIHVPEEYAEYSVNYRQYLREYDYALIYVEEDLSEYGRFYLSVPLDKYLDGNGYTLMASVTGFPQTDWFAHGKRKRSDGKIDPGNYNNKLMWFKAYTAGGMSGGPVFLNENYAYKSGDSFEEVDYNSVFAIYSGSEKVNDCRAVRINEDMLSFYYNNPNLT